MSVPPAIKVTWPKVAAALRAARGYQKEAANVLGISRTTLHRYLVANNASELGRHSFYRPTRPKQKKRTYHGAVQRRRQHRAIVRRIRSTLPNDVAITTALKQNHGSVLRAAATLGVEFDVLYHHLKGTTHA